MIVADRGSVPGMHWSRIRWRLRGALMWPAFALFTVVDTLLLALLPFSGDGAGVAGSLLLAGFANLLMVGVVGPLAGRVLTRRARGGRPVEVADDGAGTVALAALCLALTAGGVAHRPEVQRADRRFAAQGVAVAAFVRAQAPRDVRERLRDADTDRLSDDLFRTCVPSAEAGRHWCVFVRTDRSPPSVRVDSDNRPNSVVSGPDNPGRR